MAQITGTAANDTLYGLSVADRIEGLGGDDHVYAYGGDDLVFGGDGDDILESGGGSDSLYGEAGNDELRVSQATHSGERVVASGGSGEDQIAISLTGAGGGTIEADGGDGNDSIWVQDLVSSTALLTLGAGRDSIRFAGWYRGLGQSAILVSDFQPGASGDRIDWDNYLISNLSGWSRTSNPFANGYLRVIQDGADALLQIDRDGAAGSGGFATLVTFQNVAANTLTAENFGGYSPDGGANVGQTIQGGSGNDYIRGTVGGDVIEGLDGKDRIDAGLGDDIVRGGDGDDTLLGEDGDDLLEGGLGNDFLQGGSGNDRLLGGDGDDILNNSEGGSDELWGEGGNDMLRFYHSTSSWTTGGLVNGGAGDDKIEISFAAVDGTVQVDAGTGADIVTLVSVYGSTAFITLGEGRDVVALAKGFSTSGAAFIDDFTAGTDGDSLDLMAYIGAALTGWDGGTNPFATGHLRLVQSGSDTLLQVDPDGIDYWGNSSFQTLLTLRNVDSASLTAANFGGYAQDGSAPAALLLTGTTAGEQLNGGLGADSIDGADGNDTIAGGAGHDLLSGGEGDDHITGDLGNDRLEGGAGADFLDGGLGNDRLYGGEGNDWLASDEGKDELYGEAGNDTFEMVDSGSGPPYAYGEILASGGSGDDIFYLYSFGGKFTVDGGSGSDLVVVQSAFTSNFTITLGEDRDTVQLATYYNYSTAFAVVVTDFTAGAGGDTLDWDKFLGTYLIGWNKTANPFAAGFVRLVQNGSDTLVQMDRDAGGTRFGFETVITLKNAAAGTFGAANFDGFDPQAPLLAIGTEGADTLSGTAGRDQVEGGGGNDVLRLYQGGDDIANGGAGDDNIFFGAALTAADIVNGGSGTDTLVIQGAYGALTLTANITQIENISILGGGNTNFGDPGTNLYDYVITTNDANFAAGLQVRVNGAALLAGEDFTFDGSAETDAKFVVYGGRGVDKLTGGLGNDIFFFAEDRFATGDVVNGGPGYDGMFLRGNYTIDFNAPGYTGLFTSIENLTLTSATDERYARGGGTEFDYNITLSDAIVKAGETLTVSGTILMASETMILDASQESDGLLRLFGGKADDTLKGGGQADLIHGNLGADILAGNGGADTFRYDYITESNSATLDHILDFTADIDKLDLTRVDADSLTAGDQAFSWIGSNAFSHTAGELRAFQSGGDWFVEGDVNGDGVGDLVIQLTVQGPTPLGAGDFLL